MRLRITCWLIGLASALVGLSWMPLPNALLRQFENLHRAPSGPLDGFAGVVVLGGGVHTKYARLDQQQMQLSEVSDRMVQAVVLLRKQPQFLLVYTSQEFTSGGNSVPATSAPSGAARFFFDMRVQPDQLIMESAAGTTRENAVFTSALPGMNITRPWLLLTSAAHMPRALATFHKVGWNVTAYPVSYRTKARVSWLDFSLSDGAALWRNLAYEALGWVEYRLRGWV
jgi:uncharacterized SAM-binding protein YcdF (DUF218 family)